MTVSNILGCTGSVILILLVPIFWPLLLPLPFLFYSSKLGLNEGIKVCLAALLIVGILGKLLGEPYLALSCLQSGIVGLLLSELFRREYSYSLTIFWGTLIMLLIGFAFFLFNIIIEGTTPAEMIDTSLKEYSNAIIEMYEKEGPETEKVEQLKKAILIIIEGIKIIYKKFYPSLIVVGTGIIVWFNVIVSKPLFRRKGIKYPDLGRADMWCAPELLVWALIAAGFTWLLPISALDFAATNVLIILSAIYVFHGLSIVLFFFNKYNVPRLTRFIIYLIIILQQLPIFLALLGLFDQWFDLRKINSKASTAE